LPNPLHSIVTKALFVRLKGWLASQDIHNITFFIYGMMEKPTQRRTGPISPLRIMRNNDVVVISNSMLKPQLAEGSCLEEWAIIATLMISTAKIFSAKDPTLWIKVNPPSVVNVIYY
jgi:hypothetical protein